MEAHARFYQQPISLYTIEMEQGSGFGRCVNRELARFNPKPFCSSLSQYA